MKDDCLDMCRQRQFIVITSGCRKEKRENGRQRGKHEAARKTERETLEKFVFLTHGDSSVLCSEEITERERVTVEKRR